MAYTQHKVPEKQGPNLSNGGTMGKTLGTQAEIYPARKPLQLRESNVGNDAPRSFAPLSSTPLVAGWSAPTNTDLAQCVVDPILLQFQAAPAFPLGPNLYLTADFYGGTLFPDPLLPDFLGHHAAALALFKDEGGVQCRAENVDDPLTEVVAGKESNREANDWNILRPLGASDSEDSVAVGDGDRFNDMAVAIFDAGAILDQSTWSEQNEDILRQLFPTSDPTDWIADCDNKEALLCSSGDCNSYSVYDALPAIPSQEMLPPPPSQLYSSQTMGLIDLESLFARSPQDNDAFMLPASSESQLYYPPLAETMGAIDLASLLVGWPEGEFLDGASGCSSSHSHAPICSATSRDSLPDSFNAHLYSRGAGSSSRVPRETTAPYHQVPRKFRKGPNIELCRLPPYFDIEAEVSRVKPFYKRGICRWDGCGTLIDLGAEEMKTHMLSVHNIHVKEKRDVRCMWPKCRDTRNGTGVVNHLRSAHLPVYHVACPLCPSHVEPYADRQKLRAHLLLHLP
ncbi:hypothetical protein C8R44DRAFT_150122 [Mycena epipterygia]|nr:hypothetical protein C8R44DRAFT_150122 [Mycena epipterygia]